MYYIALDGGTTNTRLRLITDGAVSAAKKLPLGAGDAGGKAPWSAAVAKAAKELLSENNLAQRDIAAVIASGMVTSEYGLFPLAHLPAPAGIADLHAGMAETKIDGLTIPCFFIPGIKQNAASAEDADMMRGEEAEVIGLLSFGGAGCTYVLPGTHCKHVTVDGEERISRFQTFMTGEMIAALSSATILRDAVDLSVKGYDPDALLRGYDAAAKNGLGAALFKTRIMKNLFAESPLACYSFFLGVLLADEIQSLARGEAKKVLIAGKPSLRDPMLALIEKRTDLVAVPCDADAIENASVLGAIRIFEYEA
ncbi:MAG: 2-dehydro-3-deoxygalactonokinase [Clostridia bacterium]|nr:2-dehydro-3-deoxygalactonokinase [Clostridia bacterium]